MNGRGFSLHLGRVWARALPLLLAGIGLSIFLPLGKPRHLDEFLGGVVLGSLVFLPARCARLARWARIALFVVAGSSVFVAMIWGRVEAIMRGSADNWVGAGIICGCGMLAGVLEVFSRPPFMDSAAPEAHAKVSR